MTQPEYDEENSAMRIYVPSVLLYPIVVYIHKHFLHPSNSQMILEFSNLYYHPQATTAIKRCTAWPPLL